ncbi:hypothetical protein [Rheinheimera sp.]|uniref:hypothetical protein n=1 Tax=Rheinheimera sp. TaxID=1869214 RepID=UPI003D2AD2A5
MSKATEAMSQLSGSVITFAVSVVAAYVCIFALVYSLPFVRDFSRQTKSGFVNLLAIVAFGIIGYLQITSKI